jgi:hypothetical protein
MQLQIVKNMRNKMKIIILLVSLVASFNFESALKASMDEDFDIIKMAKHSAIRDPLTRRKLYNICLFAEEICGISYF